MVFSLAASCHWLLLLSPQLLCCIVVNRTRFLSLCLLTPTEKKTSSPCWSSWAHIVSVFCCAFISVLSQSSFCHSWGWGLDMRGIADTHMHTIECSLWCCLLQVQRRLVGESHVFPFQKSWNSVRELECLCVYVWVCVFAFASAQLQSKSVPVNITSVFSEVSLWCYRSSFKD